MTLMQEQLINPFAQSPELWQLEFDTYYKFLPLLELLFEDEAVSLSSYELSSEAVEAMPQDKWHFIGYFTEKPNKTLWEEKLTPYKLSEISLLAVEKEDWVSLVQSQAKAVITTDFFVAGNNLIHQCPANKIPIIIEAGRAFGTGEHATTKGCLEALSYLKNENVNIALDVGTGSGVLAIAAKKLWPSALIYGTEIDIVALEVAKQNADINNADIILNDNYNIPANIEKFDLIVSNILAKPLIEMAPDFQQMLKKDGKLILSGFIENQLHEVYQAYQFRGFEKLNLLSDDNWQILILVNNN